jgi:hypothetical protein
MEVLHSDGTEGGQKPDYIIYNYENPSRITYHNFSNK